ncbi:chitosanase-glucanase [Oxalobacteraceae bacterium IMCC9480]|nr:chitosanase-glucanase [Oxalobacteraceae bacterium IMCC9480]
MTRFSTWNADKVVDTIFVNGCVTGIGDVSSSRVAVRSSGIDYSGLATATTNSEGKFRVAIRRNGLASISTAYPRRSAAVRAGPSATDITLDACLTLSPASEKSAPVFFAPLLSMVAPAGSPVAFYALVVFDEEALRYQWFRNGRAIDGATQSIYRLPVVTSADDQAQFTVTVTNSFGSTTSPAATLSVTAAATLLELDYLFKMLFSPFDLSAVTSAPLNLFESNGKWLDPAAVCRTGTATGLLNGQPIAAGTETSGFNQVVSGTFDKCVTRDDPTIELSGFSTVNETSNSEFTVLDATRRADNFRRISRQGNGQVTDVTGNGSEKSTSTISTVNGLEIAINVSAPLPGATLRNNLTGEVTQFISGDTVLGSTEIISGKLATLTIEQRSRTFTIGGVRYVANGLVSFPSVTDYQLPGPEQLRLLNSAPVPTGQLSLTRNGFQIGRIFFTAEGPFVEINGVVKPMFSRTP